MSYPTSLQTLQRLLFIILPLSLDYNYDDPTKWPEKFQTCSGVRQSPISIYTNKAIPIELPPLQFNFYDDPLSELVTVKNNGYTIEFEVPETIFGPKPFLRGGSLRNDFIAESVHFHWGSPEQKGSEHVLNGRRYDMEMHVVHKNSKYATIAQAREFRDGLSVVAVLFKAVASEEVYFPGLDTIFETLDDLIKFNSTSTTREGISLGSLLGGIYREDFITYFGSLTTPPCSEAVTWNIFPEILPISSTQLSKLWNILDSRGRPLQKNFRPIQPRGHRKVYRRAALIWNENFINAPQTDFIDYSSFNLI